MVKHPAYVIKQTRVDETNRCRSVKLCLIGCSQPTTAGSVGRFLGIDIPMVRFRYNKPEQAPASVGSVNTARSSCT
ncbi:hypothetical protein HBI56_216530 [Parastagonospora nodorum]|uniref:Uncharacterized protein n=1 Tax=Phaeosphaeria nodorum (strain SN15 / ATCC MYA-4574 / FGSC 10173) TaxID=321614 RepID=A0A7U2F464_PHANO|nr:hypothetical protein HBH56_175940 [Parastagonospora nodorum]QRC96229.1 hypothetical protein JI435_408480 [Parastagonospora nodorum SN15]KAH3926360.1 hypothetical protein HBH54_167230 [Parastagonospora nodorum]KAH3939126.1 hypothetical protein HBH53_239700 [Parastagonospora nodorum]KAH3965629.1 hypothetical protein HBH52_203870 [Parastagonospora nodorum]